MNKKSILYILLDLVFLEVFNTVFFMIGGIYHPISVWISYGFIHFSYMMILVMPFLVRKSSSAVIFGFSLYSVSTVYFFVEFIVGLVFIFVKNESYKFSLIVQLIILGIYMVVLFCNLIANEYTADSVERHEEEVAYIKNLASRVKNLLGKASDKKANKEIEKVYDLLHSSPSRSLANVKLFEEEINNKVVDLEDAVVANETVVIITITSEIIEMVEKRNRKLRFTN